MSVNKKRMNFKDDFEMLYLRHEYIKRPETLNGSFVTEFAGIVNTTSRIMFDKLRPNFEKVGFNQDDIIAITNVYMLGYMSLYSLLTNPKELEKYFKKHSDQKGALDSEIRRVDRNRLINFLRQRLFHCSTICARKARNITVGSDRRGIFAFTTKTTKASEEMILEDYKKYGYRKVTHKEFRIAKEKAKKLGQKDLFDAKGFKIVKIELLNNGIGEEDYKLISSSDQSMFLNNPEKTLQLMQEELAMETYKQKFNSMTLKERKALLSKFVNGNSSDKKLKTELRIARKLLKNTDIMV